MAEELKRLYQEELVQEIIATSLDTELDRIGNAIFEEEDPVICNQLWNQFYLVERCWLDRLGEKLRIWGAINRAERLGVK